VHDMPVIAWVIGSDAGLVAARYALFRVCGSRSQLLLSKVG
jgi:hypothetical protein